MKKSPLVVLSMVMLSVAGLSVGGCYTVEEVPPQEDEIYLPEAEQIEVPKDQYYIKGGFN